MVVAYANNGDRLVELRQKWNDDVAVRDEAAVLNFVKRFSIRTHNADAVMQTHIPDDFQPGYKSRVVAGKKRKRGEQIVEYADDMTELERNQFDLAYNYLAIASGYDIGPRAALKRNLQKRNPFYSIMTNSRQCPNKGDNHTTACQMITVRTGRSFVGAFVDVAFCVCDSFFLQAVLRDNPRNECSCSFEFVFRECR